MRIAFAGNPNSGKTTMYNALPGLIVVAAIVAVIVTLINKTNKSLAAEYALKK